MRGKLHVILVPRVSFFSYENFLRECQCCPFLSLIKNHPIVCYCVTRVLCFPILTMYKQYRKYLIRASRYLFHYSKFFSMYVKLGGKLIFIQSHFYLLYGAFLEYLETSSNITYLKSSHKHFRFHSVRCKWYLLLVERTNVLVSFFANNVSQRIAKETFLLLGCNTSERYFINGEWNRQRGQKLTCYIVRAIHWTGRNTQHEPRNCTDLHSECTRAMRSLTAIVVFARAIPYGKNRSTSLTCSFSLSHIIKFHLS